MKSFIDKTFSVLLPRSTDIRKANSTLRQEWTTGLKMVTKWAEQVYMDHLHVHVDYRARTVNE
jgi:hypothetical protein